MLSYPAFQVDGGPGVGAFRLPFEVDLTILVLGVLVGHLSPVNDVYFTISEQRLGTFLRTPQTLPLFYGRTWQNCVCIF